MGKAKKAGGGDTYIFNVGNNNQLNQGMQGLQGPQGVKRLAAMLLRALNGAGGCGQPQNGCCSSCSNPNFGGGGCASPFSTAGNFNFNMQGFLG